MPASPQWKVYDSRGSYQAACKELEAAAAVVAIYADGATIRHGHSKHGIVWTEGKDGLAAQSYDDVATIALERLDEIQKTYITRGCPA